MTMLPDERARLARGWRAGVARMRFPASSPLEIFSVLFLALLVLSAVFADMIPGLAKPGFPWGDFSAPPELSLNGLLGTDGLGRSILSRLIYGGRETLVIVTIATLISLSGGLVLGMIAGFFRGPAERAVDLLANTMSALPPVLIILALVSVTGTSLLTMTLVLGLLDIGTYARITKGGVIGQSERDYVLAARALGAGRLRILVREILPNLVPTLTAVVPPIMAGLIITEGSLSFLGYGIPAPAPSWGGMIAGSTDLISRFPLLILGPVLVIVLTVYALNTVGDLLARRVDVRERQL